MIKETFNSAHAGTAQAKYCHLKGYPHFAPDGGQCHSCRKNIYAKIDHGDYSSGISVDKAGKSHITGCPHCHRSFCD